MTDSPARYPSNPQEQPILDELSRVRNQLELMRADKSCFLKACDVKQLYDDIIPQVHALNDVRAGQDGLHPQTQVDVVLDDCFNLISLAFLTIGKNSELPAIYSVISTIKRLLDHLAEAAFCTKPDLKGIEKQLQHYREQINSDKDKYDPHIVKHLETQISLCEKPLAELVDYLNKIPADLEPTYERLVSILRSLCAMNLRSKFPKEEVLEMAKELKEIQHKLGEPDPPQEAAALKEQFEHTLAHPPKDGRAIVTDLLSRNQIWAVIMQDRPAFVSDAFRGQFKKLNGIRNNLESKFLVQTWSIRETDLFIYMRQLNKIDDERTADGEFLCPSGKPADLQTQRTLLYLLRKGYVLIYRMLTSSHPVSEALLPIYNQTKTLMLCLKEVEKAGGVGSPRELYPYTMKLASIESLQNDEGSFVVNDDIPEGQDVVQVLLRETRQLLKELAAESQMSKRNDSDDSLTKSVTALKV